MMVPVLPVSKAPGQMSYKGYLILSSQAAKEPDAHVIPVLQMWNLWLRELK